MRSIIQEHVESQCAYRHLRRAPSKPAYAEKPILSLVWLGKASSWIASSPSGGRQFGRLRQEGGRSELMVEPRRHESDDELIGVGVLCEAVEILPDCGWITGGCVFHHVQDLLACP